MPDHTFELDLYLIRHGESASNVAKPGAGPWDHDTALTARGTEQMRALGARLKKDGVRFDAVYSSTLKRAHASASVMLEAMGDSKPRFERVPALDELRVQLRDGQPFDQRLSDEERRSRSASGQWWVYGDRAGERVESERLLQRRVMSWIEDILLNAPSPGRRTVAVVMHGHALRTALHAILGFEGIYIRRFQVDNASISRLRYNASGWFPVSINDAWHTHEIGDANREREKHPGA